VEPEFELRARNTGLKKGLSFPPLLSKKEGYYLFLNV
jgi:hypothetical protein